MNMKVYTKNDIANEITKVVLQFIGEGYNFNIDEMNASYSGRVGTVKLYNPNAIEKRRYVNVYMTREESDWDNYDEVICYIDLVIEADNNSRMDNSVEIMRERFYGLNFGIYHFNRNRELVYTKDIEMAIACENKRNERRNSRRMNKNHSMKNYDADKIIKIVNNRHGYKSCRKSQITDVMVYMNNLQTRTQSYRIYIEGKKNPVIILAK